MANMVQLVARALVPRSFLNLHAEAKGSLRLRAAQTDCDLLVIGSRAGSAFHTGKDMWHSAWISVLLRKKGRARVVIVDRTCISVHGLMRLDPEVSGTN